MLAIDFHTHAMRPDLIPASVLRLRARATLSQRGFDLTSTGADEAVDRMTCRIIENMNDPEATHLRRAMESVGTGHAVIVGLDWGLVGEPVDVSLLYSWLDWARPVVEAHAGFFSFVIGVDPRRPEAASVTHQALTEPWVAGVKLYPPAGFAADDPACDPIYAAATGAGAFVMCHTGRQTYPFDLMRGRVEQYAAVQRKHPDLRLVLAHAGAPLWGPHAIEVCAGHPSTYLEVSGWHHLMTKEPDRLRAMLESMWRSAGPQRVLFGSDYLAGPGFDNAASAVRQWKDFFEQTASDFGIDLGRSQAAARDLLHRSITTDERPP
jgi:uncharacterized protein